MEVGGGGWALQSVSTQWKRMSAGQAGIAQFLWYRTEKLTLLRQDDLCRVRSSTHVVCEFTAVCLKPLQSVKLARLSVIS